MLVKIVSQAQITKGTRVFVRCDLDVAIKDGLILETFRLEASLKTLRYIIDQGGFPIIAGHLGRPGGKFVPQLSTSQLTNYFVSRLGNGFELLENLRFDSREEGNDLEYAGDLAKKADIYVNESFATCHRNSASITGVAKLLPAYAGFQLASEVASLKKVMDNPARPMVVIIGGAKIESKKPVIQKFAQFADAVLVGGRLALEEPITLDKVYCPIDYVDDKDIGPTTLAGWHDLIFNARTIMWAGPLGLFEEEKYSVGTKTIGEWVGEANASGCFTVAGGGDTVTALNRFKLFDKFSFVSTGGSAMLDFLVEGNLPGIEVLN